jgi:flavin reductase (DIM6/NTAB) family NADH-FMN oxidoreductase RutF
VDRFPGGDHSIFVAAVLDGSVEKTGTPLLYYRGRYRKLAD